MAKVKTIEEKVNEIIKKSKGHQVTYQYGEEDGSMVEDQAIPLGWFKEWLKVGLTQIQKETEISSIKMTLSRINLNESNAYPLVDESESLKDVKEALINRLEQLNKEILLRDDIISKLIPEQQCEEYPYCADDYCITHKQHMRFCMGDDSDECR